MSPLWDRYQKYPVRNNTLGISVDIAVILGEDAEAVFHALNHLAANDTRVRKQSGETAGSDTFVLT